MCVCTYKPEKNDTESRGKTKGEAGKQKKNRKTENRKQKENGNSRKILGKKKAKC